MVEGTICDIMRKLPLEIWKRYVNELRARTVPESQRGHYVKWVRYFLDYRERQGAGAEPILAGFLGKLTSKGQSVPLQEQARRAVEWYLELFESPESRLDGWRARGVEGGARTEPQFGVSAVPGFRAVSE